MITLKKDTPSLVFLDSRVIIVRWSQWEWGDIESNTNGQDIIVLNGSSTPATTAVSCEVFNKPAAVEWDYVVVASKALYNAAGSTNFSLHESEETELVNVILELAGIVINKPGLVQLAAQREANAKAMQDK